MWRVGSIVWLVMFMSDHAVYDLRWILFGLNWDGSGFAFGVGKCTSRKPSPPHTLLASRRIRQGTARFNVEMKVKIDVKIPAGEEWERNEQNHLTGPV